MGILDFLPGPLNLPGMVPDIAAPFVGGGAAQPTYNEQLPSYRSQLVKKYQELSPDYATLPEPARNALLDYDAGRVARGQPPMTREQSLGAIQTIRTGKPATPEPDRSPMDFLSNAVSDIGDIVKSIPRIPSQLVSEVQQLPNMGQHIADAARDGKNGIQALTSAPGIRLLPGAYTAGNLAGGTSGIREALSHPVMSLLDVLPFAEGIARTTAVGGKATELAQATGRSPKALKAVATRNLDASGNLVPNTLARGFDYAKVNTKLGQTLDAFGGQTSRAAMRGMNAMNGNIRNINNGMEAVTTEAQAAARESKLLFEKYDITDELAKDTHRRMTLDDWEGATPEQLAYHAEYKPINGLIADYGISEQEYANIYNPRNPDVSELLPFAQAQKVKRAQMMESHHGRMAERNTRARLGSTRTLDDITADVDTLIADTTLSKSRKRAEFRAITHELDAAGYDNSLIRTLNASPKFGDNLTNFQAAVHDFAASAPVAVPRHSAADLITLFQQYGAAGNRQADRLVQALRNGNPADTLKALRSLESHASKIPELAADPTIAASIKSLTSRSKYLSRTERIFNERTAATAAKRASDTIDNNMPARWSPLVEKATASKLTDYYMARSTTPEQAAGIAELIDRKNYSQLPDYDKVATEKHIMDTAHDVSRTWREMQESGLDPTFVHRIGLNQRLGAMNASVSEVPNTIRALKERTLDMTPHQRNATVSISHAANEWLYRKGSEEWIEQTVRTYGTKTADLKIAYQDRVDRYLQRHPEADTATAYEAVLSQTHTPFSASGQGYNWGGSRLSALDADAYMIPNALARNLKAMHDPKGLLGGIVDPVTKAFRISVIGLSPRTQLYNIMGGATMTMGQIGLPALIKHMRTGMEYARNPQAMLADPRVGTAMRNVMGSQKELFEGLDRAQITSRVGDMAEYMKGHTMGRVWQQIQEAKSLGKVKDGFGKVLDKSYNWNGLWDDAYKVTTYLAEYDKRVGKGLSKEAAELAGLELLRKTQPDWAGLTPIERNLMKSVFPFYGFMSHSIKYVMQYPMDHPLRTNILANFARAELEDNSTLPGNFLSNLFITGQNDNGRATALSLAAFNPFGDVANTLSLAGWMGATNPLFQTAFEQVGLDRGKADLYPTLRYDPESGRLSADSPNILESLLGNTIPQSQIATAILGVNQDFKDKLRQDPWAAARSLASAAGLPLLWRGLNVPQEQAKAEIAREKSAQSVLTAARKTGDWSEALRYPSLSAYMDQIRTLTPEQLAPFQARPDEQQQMTDAVNGTGGAGAGAVPITQPIAPFNAAVSNTGGF